LEEAHTQDREMWKKLAFVLIDFEEGCFSLLSLFYLSKKHVFVTFSRIPLNITSKVTPGCRVCIRIGYGAKCNSVRSLE